MYRTLHLFLFLMLYLGLLSQPLRAQESGCYVPAAESFLKDSPEKLNDAHLIYGIESGELRNVYAPEMNHRYGVSVSSAYPLGSTRLSGWAAYIRHYRKGQRYSGMFRPASPLIDFADTLSGNQKGETYRLAGRIVHALSYRWKGGVAAEYLAGNNAKDTDPRNKNSLNQITIAPDVLFHTGPLQLGITFSWRHERENVSYGSFGNETKNGVTFYPLWFYTNESFANGLNAQRDYLSNFYKATLNLQYHGKTGYTAFRPAYSQNNTRIWINTATKQSGGETAASNFHLENLTSVSTSRYLHRFEPSFSHSRHKVYDVQQQLSADNRIYETVLKIKRAEVSYISAGLHYGISPTSCPDETVKASLEYKKRNSLFRLPPTDFRQEVTQLNFSAAYTRPFLLFDNVLKGGLQIGYSTGNGSQPDLSLLSDKTVFQLQRHLLNREFQYLTASVFDISIKLKYIFHPSNCALKFYIKAQNQFQTTCNASDGSVRANSFRFSTGVLF